MPRSGGPSRIRVLADRYRTATGEMVYSGREDGARHYFSTGLVVGDAAALTHMIDMCRQAGVPTE